MTDKKSPALESRYSLGSFLPLALLTLTFLLVPLAPDEKLIRIKLLIFELGAFLTVLTILGLGLFQGGWSAPRSPLLFATGVYALITTALWAMSPDRSFASAELRRDLFFAGVALVCALCAGNERAARCLLWAWSVGAFVACLYGGLQRLGHLGPVHAPQLDRVMSTFGNPIFFASFALASFFATLALVIFEGSRVRRAVLIVVLSTEVIGLVLAQTRASWIGLVAGVVLFATGWQGKRRGLATITVLGLAAILFAASSRHIWSRDQGHFLIWRDTLKMWHAHPLTGVGLGRFHLEFPQYAGNDLKAKWPQNQVVVNYAHNESSPLT